MRRPCEPTLIFFGVGLMWVYVLALFSIRRLSQALGPERWRILRTIGMEYVSFAFLSDFVAHPLHANARSLIGYVPFATLAIAGTTLRIAAWARRRQTAMAQPAMSR